MKSKTILRFSLLLLVTVGGMFFLSAAANKSAEKIRLQKESFEESIAGTNSNTDYIFFESISKLFVTSISK